MQPRLSRRGVAGLAVFFGTLALLLLSLAIDARWLRPLIRHHIDARSHRQIDFDGLRFGLTAALDPVIVLHGLSIENAAWAAPRPFVRAGEVRFVMAWASLWSERITIKTLTLIDADVDFERQADGLRNWRLTHPDDRGPGRVDVRALVARRTALRFVHQGIGLELETRIDPLAQPATLANARQWPLTQRIAFSGKRSGTAFAGEVDVSDVLTFFDTGTPFALRGSAQAADGSLQVEGLATDMRQLARLDVDLHLAAARLSGLAALTGRAALPASPPFKLATRLKKQDGDWTFDALGLTIGSSDLSGKASLREAGERQRRQFALDLRSRVVAAADLRGSQPAPPPVAASAATAAAASETFDLAPLRDSDGSVYLHIDRLSGVSVGGIAPVDLRDFKFSATLRQGVLTIDPASFALAKGRVTASLHADVRESPTQVSFDASAQGVPIEPLLPRAKQPGSLQGDLRAHVAIASRGDSLSALLAVADGSMQVGLSNASLPPKLEAELGLDAGRWLTSLFKGGERATLRCAQAAIALKQGRGTIEKLLLETDRLQVVGAGHVDIVERRFDLTLTPQETGRSLLALDRSIHVSGSGGRFATELVDTQAHPAVPACEGVQ